MNNLYQITEFQSFTCEKEVPGSNYVSLPKDLFEKLENFILSNRSKDTDALELMTLSAKKGIGKTITAKNYVGLITMDGGASIEILPKIYSKTGDEDNPDKVKRLLIEMLKTLRNAPYKSFQATNINVEKMSVFEIFIRMFIDEIWGIVKRGLRCNYETISSNEGMVKGKIAFSEHIKRNFAHKEMTFVEYDEFNSNRPENKLLKSTLVYLYRKTNSSKNKSDLKTLINIFGDIDESENYDNDFSKIISSRNTKDYEIALMWAKVFLKGKSFTSFSGSAVSIALLFPMETLFESYLAVMLKKQLDINRFTVSLQDKRYHLFDHLGDKLDRRFLMKPDIVVTDRQSGLRFVLDTKWKVLSNSSSNFGISQSDMYQMYAYQKKYDSKKVVLIYPLTNQIDENNDIEYISDDGVVVNVKFVDMFNVKDSILNITRLICNFS